MSPNIIPVFQQVVFWKIVNILILNTFLDSRKSKLVLKLEIFQNNLSIIMQLLLAAIKHNKTTAIVID